MPGLCEQRGAWYQAGEGGQKAELTKAGKKGFLEVALTWTSEGKVGISKAWTVCTECERRIFWSCFKTERFHWVWWQHVCLLSYSGGSDRSSSSPRLLRQAADHVPVWAT